MGTWPAALQLCVVRVLPIYLTNPILGFRTGFASFWGHTVASCTCGISGAAERLASSLQKAAQCDHARIKYVMISIVNKLVGVMEPDMYQYYLRSQYGILY